MDLLVLGDLHLGEDGFAPDPHPSWKRFDAILTVGDVAHSHVTVTDGKPHQEELVGLEEARAFYRRLDELGVPVLTVPGRGDRSDSPSVATIGTRVCSARSILACQFGVDSGSTATRSPLPARRFEIAPVRGCPW